MLAVHPAPLPAPHRHRPRGRSTQVSRIALARKLSEERVWPEKPHVDPPLPPPTLNDQLHIAYALDDLPRARMILLQIRGIHVTSPSDPRVATVTDADFDAIFVPHPLTVPPHLLCEPSPEQTRRGDRLKRCQQVWEEEKRRMREECDVGRRRKEEKRRLIEHRKPRIAPANPRNVVSYSALVSSSSAGPSTAPAFVYDCMPRTIPPPPRLTALPLRPTTPRTPPPPPRTIYDDSHTVSFQAVLQAMHGPLFPFTLAEQRRTTPSRDRNEARQTELLDTLLRDVEHATGSKGKGKARQVSRPDDCKACRAAVSVSRPARRWYPFSRRRDSGASSSSSSGSSTAGSIWSMSTSPASSPPHKSWFRPHDPEAQSPLRHSCLPHARTRLHTPVPLACTPLAPASPPCTPTPCPASPCLSPPPPVVQPLTRLLTLARAFQIAYISAAQFSVAASTDRWDERPVNVPPMPSRASERGKLRPPGYRAPAAQVRVLCGPAVRAGARVGMYTEEEDNEFVVPRQDPLEVVHPSMRYTLALTPTDPRPTLRDDDDAEYPLEEEEEVIECEYELRVLYPPVVQCKRTPLPNPLPYTLHFKPHPAPTRPPTARRSLSPCHSHSYSFVSSAAAAAYADTPRMLNPRARLVANPLLLRQRALHNALVRGAAAAGVPVHRVAGEGEVWAGRERVVGVAWEGRGGSALRWGAL
ncbi:hypothetical protein BD779DRAFT_1666953 [Infundibulicybe gibba]|nr:hypothetical protein BD779DRAFT_1666953 [Infundibulicybe gibba]